MYDLVVIPCIHQWLALLDSKVSLQLIILVGSSAITFEAVDPSGIRHSLEWLSHLRNPPESYSLP